MKIYLASQYSQNELMRSVRDALVSAGHEVTSRWIDLHVETGTKLEQSFTPDFLARETEFCAVYGQADVDDIRASDTVVSYTSPNGGGKGGRHVEFGIGLASGKRMIVVGPRENIFHTLSAVEVVESTADLLALIGATI